MIAHVYKQAYEYFPDHDTNMPKPIIIELGEPYNKIACEDCDGTGVFSLSDKEQSKCVCCKGTGEVYVSMY